MNDTPYRDPPAPPLKRRLTLRLVEPEQTAEHGIEQYSGPVRVVVGKYPEDATDEDVNLLMRTVAGLQQDGAIGVVLREGSTIELWEEEAAAPVTIPRPEYKDPVWQRAMEAFRKKFPR